MCITTGPKPRRAPHQIIERTLLFLVYFFDSLMDISKHYILFIIIFGSWVCVETKSYFNFKMPILSPLENFEYIPLTDFLFYTLVSMFQMNTQSEPTGKITL